MIRGLWWVACLLAVLPGCGDDAAPAAPAESPTLFYEPLRFCITGTAAGDTLFVFNFGDAALVWTPVRVPDALHGMSGELHVPPGSGVAVVWTWPVTGPYPVVDTLLARSNDPAHPLARIAFHREDPTESAPPLLPPEAPLLAFPADGAHFGPDVDEIPVGWSREHNCAAVASYTLQVAADPGFQRVLLQETVTTAEVTVLVEPGDRGSLAYWRVRTRVEAPGRGRLTGPWSTARSWRLEESRSPQ